MRLSPCTALHHLHMRSPCHNTFILIMISLLPFCAWLFAPFVSYWAAAPEVCAQITQIHRCVSGARHAISMSVFVASQAHTRSANTFVCDHFACNRTNTAFNSYCLCSFRSFTFFRSAFVAISRSANTPMPCILHEFSHWLHAIGVVLSASDSFEFFFSFKLETRTEMIAI